MGSGIRTVSGRATHHDLHAKQVRVVVRVRLHVFSCWTAGRERVPEAVPQKFIWATPRNRGPSERLQTNSWMMTRCHPNSQLLLFTSSDGVEMIERARRVTLQTPSWRQRESALRSERRRLPDSLLPRSPARPSDPTAAKACAMLNQHLDRRLRQLWDVWGMGDRKIYNLTWLQTHIA